MLKKLTALSLSLLICLSLLPSQAGAMDVPKNEEPLQAEDMENLGSFNGGDTGIAPCFVVSTPIGNDPGGTGGAPLGDYYGGGGSYGGGSIGGAGGHP